MGENMNKIDLVKLIKERNNLIKELEMIREKNDIVSLYLIKYLYYVSENRLKEIINKTNESNNAILKKSLEYEKISNLKMLKTSNRYFNLKKKVKRIDNLIKKM